MYAFIRWSLTICLFFVISISVVGQVIVVKESVAEINVSKNLHYFEDRSATLSLSNILTKPFKINTQAIPNWGSTHSVFWLKFSVRNPNTTPTFIEIRNTLIDKVDYYLLDSEQVVKRRESFGRFYADMPRDLHINYYAFRIPQSTVTQTIMIRLESSLPLQVPVYIATEQHLYERSHLLDTSQGIYMGIILVMIFYNLFLWVSIRDNTYLFYIGYVLPSGLLIADFKGYITEFIWANTTMLVPRYIFVLTATSVICSLLFASSFLNIPKNAPSYRVWFKVLIVSTGLSLIPGLLGNKLASELSVQVVTGGSALFLIFLGFKLMARGVKEATFYTFAWVLFLIGVIIFMLQIDGLVPANDFTRNAIQWGSALETILLSLALADRINILKLEKEAAQLRFILQLQETDKMRSRLARDLHDDMGSTLSSISILSQVAQNQEDTNLQKELLQKISVRSQKMLDAMHDIVWTTQPVNDTLGSVAVRMREFAGEVLDAKNIDYFIDMDEKLLNLTIPSNRHYDFYLIFKEAINNAAKYSKASQVNVKIWQVNSQEMMMEIEDNGIGFDPEKVDLGNGLKNMKRRASSLQGNFQLFSKINQGTSLKLTLPITQSCDTM